VALLFEAVPLPRIPYLPDKTAGFVTVIMVYPSKIREK
jgi:hypothetical protein